MTLVKQTSLEFETLRFRDPILDSINEGVFTIGLDWRITSFNKAAEKITGISRKDAIGHRCNEVFRANICENSCALKTALETGEGTSLPTVYVIDSNGTRIPIRVSAAILKDNDGNVIGGVETFEDLRQLEQLRKKLQNKHAIGDIVGKSAVMTKLFELVPQVATSDSSVLLYGATGTGKELFARAIHDLSPRRKKRFVAVNCSALPDTLLESELFGYKAGAFTDAKKSKLGRFALAEGGTLFLDEIGDISPAMQVSLLRVLQEKTFEPLGSTASVKANVRIITATNKNLEELVKQGFFREDLYYRIHVVRLDLPSLVQRREDIPLLVDHFIKNHNLTYDKEVIGLSPESLALIMKHNFPGNIRELQNALEHAFVLCQKGIICPHHLPPYLSQKKSSVLEEKIDNINLKEIQKDLIKKVLIKNKGNKGLTARELGINPSTLYRKIKQYKIKKKG